MMPVLTKAGPDAFMFACDWLGVSVRFEALPSIKPSLLPAGYRALELQSTNVWHSRIYLINEYGQKVATVLSDPISSMLGHLCGLVEVENEWLYHGIGAVGVVDLVQSVWPCTVTGLSRVDVCCDFCPGRYEWNIIKGLSTGAYYVQGKRSGSGFWSTSNDKWLADQYKGERIPHSQSWGHKTSSVKWKIYYKTKELADAAGGGYLAKPYIVDLWRVNGMDITNVWRVEVSIKNANGIDYDGLPLSFEALQKSVFQVFKAFFKARFVIRKTEGHRDKSNDTVCNLLSFDEFSRPVRCKQHGATEPRDGRITLLRHLDHSLDDPFVLCSDEMREDVLWHMKQIIEHDNLDLYFATIHGCSFESWMEQKRVEAFEGPEKDRR